jgi:serine/threonine protein kinase
VRFFWGKRRAAAIVGGDDVRVRQAGGGAHLAAEAIQRGGVGRVAGETHFLVMEYVEGTDLGRLIQERGPLPVDRACDYVRQAALGLQHAFEQGMVHRDLKPHNLMLTCLPSGGRQPPDRVITTQGADAPRSPEIVKILDFGLARFAGDAAPGGVTGSGMVLGTVDYIAPEQADNAHEADIRSDISPRTSWAIFWESMRSSADLPPWMAFMYRAWPSTKAMFSA